MGSTYISRDELQKQLQLTPLTLKNFLHYYLLKNQLYLFTKENTSTGMKIPNESYIPSSILSSDLPIIILNVPQNLTDDDDDDKQSIIENMENSISAEFLKRLGCRTVNVQSFVHAPSLLTNSTISNSHTMKTLIQHLMEERDNMSEGDLHALKQSECLREIGVREVPDLQKLIDRIIEEHNEQKKESNKEYKLPIALKFLAENFQQHYSKLWKAAKIKRPFLPSISLSKTIILSLSEEVFKDKSPLCATLLPNVVQLFEENFNISLLGVKDCPTLTTAFDILMEKKEEILNVETARKIFAYMNELDGLSRTLIERVSKLAFIPLKGNDNLMKPSQVFIHPDNSTTTTSSSRL
ncbi:unnamed protein product [Rotaria sp. Silwood1]|nr:unnamed protein product [Rotaria sp. Silwood1]